MKKVTLQMEIEVDDSDVSENEMHELMGILRHKFHLLNLSEEISLACIDQSKINVSEMWGVEL